jgi:hypothetical protein
MTRYDETDDLPVGQSMDLYNQPNSLEFSIYCKVLQQSQQTVQRQRMRRTKTNARLVMLIEAPQSSWQYYFEERARLTLMNTRHLSKNMTCSSLHHRSTYHIEQSVFLSFYW